MKLIMGDEHNTYVSAYDVLRLINDIQGCDVQANIIATKFETELTAKLKKLLHIKE